MKKLILLILGMVISSNMIFASVDLLCPKILLTKIGINKFDKGEAFAYPLKEGQILECYAKRINGSIDYFTEFNDYFVMRDGNLYSNTMHKYYKPNKTHMLKKVDRVKMSSDNETLKLYDPLWELPLRRHVRKIEINTKTGEYYMQGSQDNMVWFRLVTATGVCRIKE